MVAVYLEVKFERTEEVKSFQCWAKSTYEAYFICWKELENYNLENNLFSVLYILKAYQRFPFQLKSSSCLLLNSRFCKVILV